MPTPAFSYWEQSAFVGHADVIIIGSRLVGLSAALTFKRLRPGAKMLVLEPQWPTNSNYKDESA